MRSRTPVSILLFLILSVSLLGCGGGPSDPATTPPAIATQPSNQTVTVGQTATFSVMATGTTPLSYQWQKGTANIAGATSSSYTTPATVMSDDTSQFRVVVSNSAGTVTSNVATLTVHAVPPSITQQPANKAVTVGQTATFTVMATGTAPLSYQWQKGTTNVAGASSASYTTPATTAGDNGSQFRVVVTNSAGNVTSHAATLTVNTPPSITQQPANKTVIAGQTATFTVVAAGTAPLSYQWQKGTTNIAGATSASYTTPATSISDNGSQFRVVVSNAAGNVTSNAATLTVNAAPPSITQQPADKTVTAGQTATFTVVAAGTAPLSYQWQKGTTNIAGATSASYITPATSTSDNGSQFRVVVSNSAGAVTSNSATLTVNSPSTTDVVTYHNDIARTGQNLTEATLTTANVNSAMFGKIQMLSVDGKVDAQPLYLSNVQNIAGGTHNVVYVVTEHGSVYAFDADTGTQLWKVSMLLSGEVPSDSRGCGQVSPEIGITSTPVIDRGKGPNGAIYVVAMSKNGSNYFQRVHALDVTTGAELFGGPKNIQATYPGTGDNSDGTNVIFDPKQYKERVGLLLLGNTLYTAWASHCDIRPYTGWIMAYNATTLAQTSVLNITPNGGLGAIWMAGAGLASDGSNIYLLDGNGDFDETLNGAGFPSNGNFGNAFMKLSTSGGLAVADYFEMFNEQSENAADTDLGSGGAMVLPDLSDGAGNTKHLAVGVGKDAHLYVVNRESMGKFNPSSNNIYQDVTGALGGVFAMPAYFNNRIYYGAVGDFVKAFTITNARFSTTATAQTSNSFAYPGATPSVSANGTSNGIVWAVENSGTAVLHAYDATNLNELYNSNQASGSRDHFGAGNKFITPTIVNGKVFVGTTNGVAVFGLLP
jgi:outer membrane protein assembly factor BamB